MAVAIKQEGRHRFVREVAMLARVQHKNLVNVIFFYFNIWLRFCVQFIGANVSVMLLQMNTVYIQGFISLFRLCKRYLFHVN